MTAPLIGNILRGSCANDCRVTWHFSHGHNRSEPGTFGGPGDVRRCEHGRLWIYVTTRENGFYCEMDIWKQISPIWNPVLHRRAVASLRRSGVLCHNGHPFVPGVNTDHAPGESDPRWCNTCGEARPDWQEVPE